MQNRETCVDCGARSPETTTDHTLVSSMGWRLMRGQHADGSWHADWRCGKCWAAHKAKGKGGPAVPADVTRVRASTTAPERTQGSAPMAKPASGAAGGAPPKPGPEIKIAPHAASPVSLVGPGRPLFRGSR
jgi:hypothetical protein